MAPFIHPCRYILRPRKKLKMTPAHISQFPHPMAQGLCWEPALQRFDTFLAVGKSYNLARNRLLGIVHESPIDDDVDEVIIEELSGIDIRNPDPQRLSPLLQRFFRTENVQLNNIFPYRDIHEPMGKWNVKGLNIDVHGERKTCFLKYMDEGYRRECLGMRVNNILTDAPVPFMASGYMILQLGIIGASFDFLTPFFSRDAESRFHFEVGKAHEYARLTALGDRRSVNIIHTTSQRVQHIDFGAAFYVGDSLERYIDQKFSDDFAAGREAARDVIRRRYAKNGQIVETLLGLIDDELLQKMNDENIRGEYSVNHPQKIVHDYLRSIGIEPQNRNKKSQLV